MQKVIEAPKPPKQKIDLNGININKFRNDFNANNNSFALYAIDPGLTSIFMIHPYIMELPIPVTPKKKKKHKPRKIIGTTPTIARLRRISERS